jgi:hypothetical protein
MSLEASRRVVFLVLVFRVRLPRIPLGLECRASAVPAAL